MTSAETKLLDCVKTVFPNVPEDNIPELTMENAAQWDSLATVTLAALIEENFGIEIEAEDLAQFTSFRNISSFLNGHAADNK